MGHREVGLKKQDYLSNFQHSNDTEGLREKLTD